MSDNLRYARAAIENASHYFASALTAVGMERDELLGKTRTALLEAAHEIEHELTDRYHDNRSLSCTKTSKL